jgi:hypothetical protein
VEEDERGGECSGNGEKRNVYRFLVGKSEKKKESTGTPKT